MIVPFNDLRRQFEVQASDLRNAMDRVASSGWYIMGPEVEHFQHEFAAYCGRKHAITVGSGTDALEIALRALDCGPGDEVITVANAGGYSTAAILLVGAIPVYADVTRETLTLCPQSLSEAISGKTKAVIVTHLYGQLAAMQDILTILRGTSIAIVEDCAQGHGASRDGVRAGAFGTIGVFSFYPTKNLGALGDGGAVVTDDDMLSDRVKLIRQYGWRTKYRSEIPRCRNSRLDELQAAVLRVKLSSLDKWNERRRQIVRIFADACQGTTVEIVHDDSQSDFVGHLCIARHSDRDRLKRYLEEHGIKTDIHYPVLDPEQQSMRGVPHRSVPMPESNRAVMEILSLPCFPELTEDEVSFVSARLQEYGSA